MSNIVRAWKDGAYRQFLSTEELAVLPANPAGAIELTEAELEAISGTTDKTDSKKDIVWEPEDVDARSEQNMTNPVMMGTIVMFMPLAPTCNSTDSPNVAQPSLLDLGRAQL